MKRHKLIREQLLYNKHEKRRLKSLRNKKTFSGVKSSYIRRQNFYSSIDNKIIKNFKSNLFTFLSENDFIIGDERISNNIEIPKNFSLNGNHYDKTIEIIKEIIFSIWNNKKEEITVDFSKCINVDQPALLLLQIIRLEILDDFRVLNSKLSVLSVKSNLKFIKSNNPNVNFHLYLCGYKIDDIKIPNGLKPIDTIGYLKGSKPQKHYLENKKGIFGTRIIEYLNKCLNDNGFEISAQGKNDLGNMVTEILNNAEDHSPLNTYYVTANYYVDEKEDDANSHTGILNLSFLNFGYSFYEGFEKTKEENHVQYDLLDNFINSLGRVPFTKENLFTLYALQDGVSRLKFDDKSRGTGTMTFINCFLEIGDYENIDRNITPRLSILSGKTQLICDNKYPTFQTEDGSYLLSLNKENSLSKPPDKNNLKSLKYSFPGTLLSVKFCLNKEHIERKLIKNGTN